MNKPPNVVNKSDSKPKIARTHITNQQQTTQTEHIITARKKNVVENENNGQNRTFMQLDPAGGQT